MTVHSNYKFLLARSLTLSALAIALMSTIGCSSIKRSVGDNSLAYTKTTQLAPVQLPADAQTLPFIPMYNVPQTNENTLDLKSDKGKRFELPRPISSIK